MLIERHVEAGMTAEPVWRATAVVAISAGSGVLLLASRRTARCASAIGVASSLAVLALLVWLLVAPWASWATLVRGECLGLALTFVAAAGYVQTKVPDLVPPGLTRGLRAASVALAVVVVFAPMPLALAVVVAFSPSSSSRGSSTGSPNDRRCRRCWG